MTTREQPPTTRPNRRNRRYVRVLLLAAGLVGLAAAVAAQPPPPKSVAFDSKSVPAPGPDFTPRGNADAKAFEALVRHSRQFPADQLNEKAIELPLADLLQRSGGDPKSAILAKPELRFQLLKFTARLARVVRLIPSDDLRKAGVTDLFEAWVFPSDRSDPLCVVVTGLPRGIGPIAAFKQMPRVLATGYFLKTIRYPAVDGDPSDVRFAPLLVGNALDLVPDPPAELLPPLPLDQFVEAAPAPRLIEPVRKTKYDFDGDLLLYKSISDFVARKDADEAARLAENTAYEQLVRHARQFDARELIAHAEEVALPELLKRESKKGLGPNGEPVVTLKMVRDDYRFKLVKFTGQLKRISRIAVPDYLADAGVTDLYELWLFPNERTEPLQVIVTDLPDGVVPTQEVKPSKTVTVAGFFFKIDRYETHEKKADGSAQGRYAPIIVGRSYADADRPDADGGHNWRTVFLPAILTGLGALTLLFLGLTWWFRSSDRAAKRIIDARRTNPFDGPAPTAE